MFSGQFRFLKYFKRRFNFFLATTFLLSGNSQSSLADKNQSTSIDTLIDISFEELLNYEVVATTKSNSRLELA